jgi:hypothetical protein
MGLVEDVENLTHELHVLAGLTRALRTQKCITIPLKTNQLTLNLYPTKQIQKIEEQDGTCA